MKIIFLFLLQVYSSPISVLVQDNRLFTGFTGFHSNVKSQVSLWKKKKLLISAVKRENYESCKLLLEEIQDISLKNIARKCKNIQILVLLVQKDAKVIEELIYKRFLLPKVLKELPSLQVLKEASADAISQIIKILGDQGEFELLRQMGKIDPALALQEIIKKTRNNLDEIQAFLEENINNFDKNDKKLVLDLLQKYYLLELIGDVFPYLVLNLKKGLDEEDLLELKTSYNKYLDLQCEICMERVKECWFSCKNSKQFGHGACRECFDRIYYQANAKCPWCRTNL